MTNFNRNQLNADSDSHLDKNSVFFSFLAHTFFLKQKNFNGQLSIIRIALIFELASKLTGKKNEMWIIGPSECNSSKWQQRKKNVQIATMRMWVRAGTRKSVHSKKKWAQQKKKSWVSMDRKRITYILLVIFHRSLILGNQYKYALSRTKKERLHAYLVGYTLQGNSRTTSWSGSPVE